MKKKIGWKVTLTALVVALALATTLPGTTAQAKSKVAMNKVKVTVCTGKSYTLKMTDISKKVKWSTSDKNVVSITKKSGKKTEKVTIKGNKKGTATVTAKVKVGKKTKTFKCQVTVKGHKYGKVTYKWNKDYSKCTASKKCSRCGKTLKQTVKASSKTTTKATCTEKGAKKYTAKFTKYGFGTKNKSVSIKMKSHSVDSNKKISYKWNGDYSKCTATFYCKNGGEKQTETVKATKQSSNGKTVYTASFKTKGLERQTKTVTAKKPASLDKTSISLRYDRDPVIVKIKNDKAISVSLYRADTGKKFSFNDEIVYGICDFISDDKKSIEFSNTFKYGADPAIAKITTESGQVLECKVTTELLPGDYKFGEVGSSYQDTAKQMFYNAYGKKAGFSKNGHYDYVVTCKTRKDYNNAWNFYNHQKDQYGRDCTLDLKSADINSACGDRANYKSKARIEWEALSDDVKESTYDDEIRNYIREKYGEAGVTYYNSVGIGFGYKVTSNAHLKQIVDDWTAVSGEKPSWYYNEDGSIYYTAFSDWAEWSGRDTNAGIYNECPVLPDNFRD